MHKSIYKYLVITFSCSLLFSFGCLADQEATAKKPRLSYKEVGRCHKYGKPSVVIKLIPEGFPTNTPLNLSVIQIDGHEIHYPEQFLVNDENEIVTLSGQPREFSFSSAAKGETVTCRLWTEDKKYIARTRFIPFPIEVKDENGHTLSIRLISGNGECFMITATGFEPKEMVDVFSNSEGEKMSHPVQVEENGTLQISMAPAVIGKYSGKASFEIKGKTTKNLKVTYDWGENALRPYKG